MSDERDDEHDDADPARHLGHVYFVEAPTLGALKIGFTRHIENRVRGLSTSCPGELRLLLAIPGYRYHERLMHDAFATYHVRGEWFTLCVGALRKLTSLAVEIFERKVAAIPYGGGEAARAGVAKVLPLLRMIVLLHRRWHELDRAPITTPMTEFNLLDPPNH